MAQISGGVENEDGAAPLAWVWSQYRGETPPNAPEPIRAEPIASAAPPKPTPLQPSLAPAGANVGIDAGASVAKRSMAGPIVALAFVVAGIVFYALLPSTQLPVAPPPAVESMPKIEAAPAPAVQSVPPTPPVVESPAADPAQATAPAPAPKPQGGARQKKKRRPHG